MELNMDAKVFIGGVVGLGLLGVAGILVLGGGGDSGDLELASASGSNVIDLDAGASAYEIERTPAEPVDVPEVEESPRDLQADRRDGRGGRGEGRRGGFDRMEEMIAQFDADGDGMLNQEERDAMAQSFRDRMTERFDLDGDGMVSIEEQFAARRSWLTDLDFDSRRGQRVLAEYDLDGDGVLSEEETAAMNARFDERDAERLAEIVEEYDTDGDGVMSDEETLAMQDQQFNEQRARWDRFSVQFDQDGDGNLNVDERVDARETMISQRQMDQFMRRYDTNGDRQIGTSDYERFTDAYGKKEPYGDVNRDGIFNMDDIVMFRDMTERANAVED
ncbi:MAG: hypothetical protein JJ974_06505 [Phycisphaerales bacterium]|nr:hypothetical protein [Phycisphaerales bacterium]